VIFQFPISALNMTGSYNAYTVDVCNIRIQDVNTSRVGLGFINTSPSYCVKESSNRQISFLVPYVTASSNVITKQLTTVF
jgi:hypothetical protein